MDKVFRVAVFPGQGNLGNVYKTFPRFFRRRRRETDIIKKSQLITYDISYMLFKELGVKFDAYAGHSVGEYAALTAAGIIPSYDVGFEIVKKRQELMNTVSVGEKPLMLLRRISEEDLSQFFADTNGDLSIALFNSPRWFVVGGTAEALDKHSKNIPGKVKIRLDVAGPFHTPHYEAIAEKKFKPFLERRLEQCDVPYSPPSYSNFDAKPHTTETLVDHLAKQIYSPVRWYQTVQNIYESARYLGQKVQFIEIGPGKSLTDMIKDTLGKDVDVVTVSDEVALDKAKGELT